MVYSNEVHCLWKQFRFHSCVHDVEGNVSMNEKLFEIAKSMRRVRKKHRVFYCQKIDLSR